MCIETVFYNAGLAYNFDAFSVWCYYILIPTPSNVFFG